MELTMPGMIAGLLIARPINQAAEPVEQPFPGGPALFEGVMGVRIDPVLEGVDRGDPGEDEHDALEELAVGPVGVALVVERIETARTQELHGHRGDLAELEWAVAVSRQRLTPAGE